jgi:hypothetical protein
VPILATYLLTPWSKVLLEKLTSLRSYPRNSPHFMEPEGFGDIAALNKSNMGLPQSNNSGDSDLWDCYIE